LLKHSRRQEEREKEKRGRERFHCSPLGLARKKAAVDGGKKGSCPETLLPTAEGKKGEKK